MNNDFEGEFVHSLKLVTYTKKIVETFFPLERAIKGSLIQNQNKPALRVGLFRLHII